MDNVYPWHKNYNPKIYENAREVKKDPNPNCDTNFKIYFTYGKDGSYTREKMPYR